MNKLAKKVGPGVPRRGVFAASAEIMDGSAATFFDEVLHIAAAEFRTHSTSFPLPDVKHLPIPRIRIQVNIIISRNIVLHARHFTSFQPLRQSPIPRHFRCAPHYIEKLHSALTHLTATPQFRIPSIFIFLVSGKNWKNFRNRIGILPYVGNDVWTII